MHYYTQDYTQGDDTRAPEFVDPEFFKKERPVKQKPKPHLELPKEKWHRAVNKQLYDKIKDIQIEKHVVKGKWSDFSICELKIDVIFHDKEPLEIILASNLDNLILNKYDIFWEILEQGVTTRSSVEHLIYGYFNVFDYKNMYRC